MIAGPGEVLTSSAETALLANETGDAGGKLYVVKWDGAAPAAPVMVLESSSKLEAHAFSYRALYATDSPAMVARR